MPVPADYPYDRGNGPTSAATLRIVPSADAVVSVKPVQTLSAPSSATVRTSGGSVETLAAGERFMIQNLGVNPIYVRRAAGATTSAFHYVLAGGGANDDGTGGSLEIDDHVGVVSVAGTAPRFTAWKV